MSTASPTLLNVANGASSIPLTPGSFLMIAIGPGSGVLNINAIGAYAGQLGVLTSIDGENIQVVDPTTITSNSTGRLASERGQGQYRVTVGGSFAYVYLSECLGRRYRLTVVWIRRGFK